MKAALKTSGELASADPLSAVADDIRLSPFHISLYAAMVYYSSALKGNPFNCSRRKLMRFSRLRSIATCHKCICQLINYGYIVYSPSYHPVKASRIYLTGKGYITLNNGADG